MNVPIFTLVSNLVGLFLLMAVGALVVKLHVVPISVASDLSKLLMLVIVPALMFRPMVRPFSMDFLLDSVVIFVAGTVLYLLFLGVSYLMASGFRVPRDQRGTWSLSATFPNNGFMGYPIIQALLGENALALAVIMSIPFNILLYTAGIRVMLTDCSGKEGGSGISLKKILLTPTNAAILLGIIVFLFQIPIPDMIYTPISYLADVATPMSMLIIGMELTKSSFSHVVHDRNVLSASLAKLVILPLLTLVLVRLIPFSNELMVPVILITMSMPTAAIAGVVAEQYEVNVKLAVEITFLTGLLCIVTMPLIFLLL